MPRRMLSGSLHLCEILRAWNARISSGVPATSRAVQGRWVMMLPHLTHRSLAAHRLSGVLNRLTGRRTLAALMRCPSRPSTQGRMSVHSMTLKTVTSRPAIPMERSSLMGRVSSAENPIAAPRWLGDDECRRDSGVIEERIEIPDMIGKPILDVRFS